MSYTVCNCIYIDIDITTYFITDLVSMTVSNLVFFNFMSDILSLFYFSKFKCANHQQVSVVDFG